MKVRSSGVLLHITSLPSPFGIGDAGPTARAFVDFLRRTRQSVWQLLPLNPTDTAHANSPYSSNSAFAGNPLLIDPGGLVADGYLTKSDLKGTEPFRSDRVDYSKAGDYKYRLLHRAFERFSAKSRKPLEFEQFCAEESFWLDDYSLFAVLKAKHNGSVWGDWTGGVRDREAGALESARTELHNETLQHRFYQFLIFKQWRELKRYANDRNISLFGDIPIYVNYDSADVWANPDLFKLDVRKKPAAVAGVPPDLFSSSGQLWGNPVFNWERMRETEYRWWLQRLRHNLKLFDLLRIDHFRGLVAYWEVGAGEPTAANGRWVEAPAENFLNTVSKTFPNLPLIAEDLGVITPDVREIMRRYAIPGMKVLLFAFFEKMETSPYIPHNHIRDCIVYTGTHDNNTVRGWFEREAGDADRRRLFDYLGRSIPVEDVAWEFIRMAMMSPANGIIIPMQDVLSLGAEARMNRPATDRGNWEWRMGEDQITVDVEERLSHFTELYNRE
jgi:4-alpha-glucanotransferase